jgi:predicted acyl esterase
VMGAEKWRAEKSWPLPASRLKEKRLFLSKQKPSAIRNDWFSVVNREFNYSLNDNASETEAAEGTPVLVHNPDRLHGKKSRSQVRWGGRMSTTWQDAFLDERRDETGVLTFTTEPLQQDLEIAGPLVLSFWARTSFDRPLKQETVQKTIELIKKIFTIDTNLLLDLMDRKDVQWVIEVNDVFPDGRARNITSGWLSAWHRPYDPAETPLATEHRIDPAYTPFDPFYDMPDKSPRPINDGELYPYAIELWPMDCVFKAGHRVRVSISGSDFPHLLPVLRPSRSTLVIDSAHPAQLDFTVVTDSGEGTDWKWIEEVNSYLAGVKK